MARKRVTASVLSPAVLLICMLDAEDRSVSDLRSASQEVRDGGRGIEIREKEGNKKREREKRMSEKEGWKK